MLARARRDRLRTDRGRSSGRISSLSWPSKRRSASRTRSRHRKAFGGERRARLSLERVERRARLGAVELLETPGNARTNVPLDVALEHADAVNTPDRADDHPADAQGRRQVAGMHRAAAAERDQAVIARIDGRARPSPTQRARHAGVGDAADALAAASTRRPSGARDVTLDRAPGQAGGRLSAPPTRRSD